MVKKTVRELENNFYDRKIGENVSESDITPKIILDVGKSQEMPMKGLQILPGSIPDFVKLDRPAESPDVAKIMPETLTRMPNQEYHPGLESQSTDQPPMSKRMVQEERPREESSTMQPITLPEHQKMVTQIGEDSQAQMKPMNLLEQFTPESSEPSASESSRKQKIRQMADLASQGYPQMQQSGRQARPIPISQTTESGESIPIQPADYMPEQVVQERTGQEAVPVMQPEQIQQYFQALQQMQAQQSGQREAGIPERLGTGPRGRNLSLYRDDFSLPEPAEQNAPDLPGTSQLPDDDAIRIDVGRAIDTYKIESSIDGTSKRDTLGQQLSDLMKRTVTQFLLEKHGEDEELAGVPKSYRLGNRAEAEELTKKVLKTFVSERYGFNSDLVAACQEDDNMLYQVFDTLMERRGYSELFLNYVGVTSKDLASGRPFDGTANTLGKKVAEIKIKTAKQALVNDEGSAPQIEAIVNKALRVHGKELKSGTGQEDMVNILGTVFAEDGKLYAEQISEYGHTIKDIERR